MTGHRVPQRQTAQFWSAALTIGMRLPPRQIGGYRTSSGAQRKLQRVTEDGGSWRRIAESERLTVVPVGLGGVCRSSGSGHAEYETPWLCALTGGRPLGFRLERVSEAVRRRSRQVSSDESVVLDGGSQE